MNSLQAGLRAVNGLRSATAGPPPLILSWPRNMQMDFGQSHGKAQRFALGSSRLVRIGFEVRGVIPEFELPAVILVI